MAGTTGSGAAGGWRAATGSLTRSAGGTGSRGWLITGKQGIVFPVVPLGSVFAGSMFANYVGQHFQPMFANLANTRRSMLVNIAQY